jgi:hypothetical protein
MPAYRTPEGRRKLEERLAAMECKLRRLTRAVHEQGLPEVRLIGANPHMLNGLGRSGCVPLVVRDRSPCSPPEYSPARGEEDSRGGGAEDA